MTKTQNRCPRTDSVTTTFVPMTAPFHRDLCVNCGEKDLDHFHACEGQCGEVFYLGDLIETGDRSLCGECWSIENFANSYQRSTAFGYGRE